MITRICSKNVRLFSPPQSQAVICLRSDQTCQGIYQLLVQNPVIQSFVRTITLNGNTLKASSDSDSQWMNSTSLLAILRLPFCCLECFSLVVARRDINWHPWNWNNFNSEMKDALLNIMHSSTLKTLSLMNADHHLPRHCPPYDFGVVFPLAG